MMEQQPQKTTAIKATEAARKVRGLVRTMYRGAQEAKEAGQPVAYCMVGCQYDEILRAMDIFPIWTENYAGLCAAKREAGRFLSKAEADGYSNVICGYVRAGLGFDALRAELGEAPPDSPDGGMAVPDVLLGCSYACDPRFKWYQAMGHYADIPTHAMDVLTPPVDADLGEIRNYYIKYQVEQLKALVEFLERNTDRRLDTDRLNSVLDMAEETGHLWRDTYRLRQAVPSPMPSQDHFNCFVPGLFMMGTPQALEFFKELNAEVKDRVDNKVKFIPEEKYRLLWGGGLPPWHSLMIFNYFADLGAVFVMETSYRPPDPVEVPPRVKDPLERIAWRHFLRSTYRHQKARENTGHPEVELLLELLEDYQCNGMFMHVSRSCRASSVGQIHFRNLVNEQLEVPTMFMESDIIDLRDYSEADTKMRIDAFMDLVRSAKARKEAAKK